MTMIRVAITAALVFALDRATKHWVVEALDLKTLRAIDVLPPYLNLRMAWNEGVNFGVLDLGRDGRWVLIAVSLVIVAALIWWIRRQTDRRLAISAGVVIGGALGNVWDRLTYGAVADFLNMSCCGIDNPYAFNVADVAIFAGAAGLILWAGETDKGA